jgi:hypothetical protein
MFGYRQAGSPAVMEGKEGRLIDNPLLKIHLFNHKASLNYEQQEDVRLVPPFKCQRCLYGYVATLNMMLSIW